MDSPLNLDTRPAPQPQVVKQAIQWMLRLRNEAPNPHLQQQCRNWRAAHQDHELAWQRVHGLQRELSSQLSRVPGAGVAFETLENSSRQLGRRQALKLLSGVLMLGSAAWLARDSLAWQPPPPRASAAASTCPTAPACNSIPTVPSTCTSTPGSG